MNGTATNTPQASGVRPALAGLKKRSQNPLLKLPAEGPSQQPDQQHMETGHMHSAKPACIEKNVTVPHIQLEEDKQR